ncbi:unnamed protein product [Paramecium primaurelia]|uniref:Uncharacterized protein n=1 Tax=Paramecium primaurelia TaxID=5886 RepID=A0A8S1NHX8_PARPR|nr:unnamed protein product [Paramecium primaurelia]
MNYWAQLIKMIEKQARDQKVKEIKKIKEIKRRINWRIILLQYQVVQNLMPESQQKNTLRDVKRRCKEKQYQRNGCILQIYQQIRKKWQQERYEKIK